MTHVLIERSGPIATVRMQREAKRNAFDREMITEMHDAALTLRREPEIAVIIVTGTDKAFSAGADMHDPRQFDATLTLMQKREGMLLGAEMARQWQTLPQVTIAAIEGYAVGGGLTLALSCDFRVMGRSAFLWVPEVDIGANYGWNTVPRLVAMAGPAAARRMILLAERVEADQARAWDLVDELADDGAALAKAAEMAARLASKPRMALAVSKRAINAAANALLDVASHGDMEQVLLCFTHHAEEQARAGARQDES